jgi:hypothetical protein
VLRAEAVCALGVLRDRDAVDTMERRLADRDPAVRVAALFALAMVGKLELDSDLARAAAEGAEAVEPPDALRELARSDPWRAQSAAAALLKTSLPRVQIEAARVLASMKQDATELVSLQYAKEAHVREAALFALVRQGRDDRLRALLDAVEGAPATGLRDLLVLCLDDTPASVRSALERRFATGSSRDRVQEIAALLDVDVDGPLREARIGEVVVVAGEPVRCALARLVAAGEGRFGVIREDERLRVAPRADVVDWWRRRAEKNR